MLQIIWKSLISSFLATPDFNTLQIYRLLKIIIFHSIPPLPYFRLFFSSPLFALPNSDLHFFYPSVVENGKKKLFFLWRCCHNSIIDFSTTGEWAKNWKNNIKIYGRQRLVEKSIEWILFRFLSCIQRLMRFEKNE